MLKLSKLTLPICGCTKEIEYLDYNIFFNAIHCTCKLKLSTKFKLGASGRIWECHLGGDPEHPCFATVVAPQWKGAMETFFRYYSHARLTEL
jgi:hypothetical protein